MTFVRDPASPGASFKNDTASTPDDGAFEVAIGPWLRTRLMRLHPEAEPMIRANVRQLVGPQFSDAELSTLEDRAITAVQPLDIPALVGVQGGDPVVMSASQKAKIDAIVRQMGEDDLGRRARAAYDQAHKSGKIRVK